MPKSPPFRPRQPPRPLTGDDDTLVDRARRVIDDEPALYSILEELWARSTRRILDRAVGLTTSSVADERWLGAEILRNLGLEDNYAFQDEVVGALMARTEVEGDVATLQWVLRCLGDRYDPRALPALLRHARSEEPQIREVVAAQLMTCATDDAATLNSIVGALLVLAADPVDRVRDWATWGLGRNLAVWEDSDLLPADDVTALRNSAVAALLDRLADADAEVRCEALRGLAVRAHPAALAAITEELLTGDQLVGLRAAADLADARLRPVLDVVEPRDDEEHAALGAALRVLDEAGF